MSTAGYTLIELLIVMVIMSIIGTIGYINYKQYAANQVTNKAAGQIQSVIRLAQTNATTGTLCGTQGGTSWRVRFETDKKTIKLICAENSEQKNYILENAEIAEIKGSEHCNQLDFPFSITFSPGDGAVSFSSPDPCLQYSPSLVISVKNSQNPNVPPKLFNISKGGAIDVQ